jgi:hypothetical protein
VLVRTVRRHPIAVALGLALLHVALALLTFEPRPHTGGDNAAYITLGTSLLERGTYTELWDPAETPHTKYPPVFPGILAIALAVGLKPWVQLKLVVVAFSACAVAMSFLWLRRRRRAALAVGVGLLLAAAPGILREGRWILSDVPFWAFTMIAIVAFERLRGDDWKRFAIGAAAVILAYFTRSAGLPLVLAALSWLAWRRYWPQLAVLAGAAGLPALLWWLRTRAYGPAGYVSEFWLVDPYLPALGTIGAADLLARMLDNAQKYVSIHLPILLTGSVGFVITIVAAGICALALFGWIGRLRRPGVAELFLPLYAGLILIWPSIWSGERFLLPLVPALLFFAGEALSDLSRRLMSGPRVPVGLAAVTLILFLALPGLVTAARVGMDCTTRYLAGERYPCLGDEAWEDFFSSAEVAGVALPEGAVILNRKPRLLHMLSGGLKSLNYPLSDDPARFFAVAETSGAQYVVVDRLDAVSDLYLRPILVNRPHAFCVLRVYARTSTALLGIRPGAGLLPDLDADDIHDDATVSFVFCPTSYWRSPEAQQMYEGT